MKHKRHEHIMKEKMARQGTEQNIEYEMEKHERYMAKKGNNTRKTRTNNGRAMEQKTKKKRKNISMNT